VTRQCSLCTAPRTHAHTRAKHQHIPIRTPRVCVCSCVCVCVCACVLLYVCIDLYVYVHICTYIYIYIHIYTYIYICIYIYIYIYENLFFHSHCSRSRHYPRSNLRGYASNMPRSRLSDVCVCVLIGMHRFVCIDIGTYMYIYLFFPPSFPTLPTLFPTLPTLKCEGLPSYDSKTSRSCLSDVCVCVRW